MKCITCDKELVRKQSKFCSRMCQIRSGNTRHQNYQCQQQRGTERKYKLISLLGGKCSKCGYNKNIAALHFHHMDPKEKERSLDLRHLSNSKWESCLEEALKCTLLCANCHAEHHHPDRIFERISTALKHG